MSTTLVTMCCQSNLSSEALMSCVGLNFPSRIHPSCPDTLVYDAPLLFFHLSFPSTPNSLGHVFSTHTPRKQAVVAIFFSVVYNVHLPLQILPHYFSSPTMISSAFSVITKLPWLSTCPSSLIKWSKFHIYTAKLTRHSNVKLVVVFKLLPKTVFAFPILCFYHHSM